MGQFFFDKILQNDGWKSNQLITTNAEGRITSIESANSANNATHITGLAIPGFQNAHSHGFQYAMAGLAEVHNISHTSDDFWSWRDAMYKLALSVNPDQMESIAAMLYAEMLRHGYTNVAEFHYVHHDKNGEHYHNLVEMGSRMIAGAKSAGIGITLVPIFYQKGGFGKAPTEGQKRFISPDIDSYLRLLESSSDACSNYEHANIGIGIHSMRGVEPKDIAEIAKSGPQDIPFHIHISEQLKEIEDSIAYLKKRPVEWMLDNVDMNDRFHLVHATHLTDSETQGIAQSKANVVICPSTEGNLGDGIFPLRDFQSYDGHWSIGTDSHVGLNPLEELRILDYGQRLITHKRNTFTSDQTGNSGEFAIQMATAAGRKAMNDFNSDYFKVGSILNTSVLERKSPLLSTCSDDNLASTIIYTSDAVQQQGTIANGMYMESGKCSGYEKIQSDFIATLNELKNR
jgi:formimidoylglutamate deiminase